MAILIICSLFPFVFIRNLSLSIRKKRFFEPCIFTEQYFFPIAKSPSNSFLKKMIRLDYASPCRRASLRALNFLGFASFTAYLFNSTCDHKEKGLKIILYSNLVAKAWLTSHNFLNLRSPSFFEVVTIFQLTKCIFLFSYIDPQMNPLVFFSSSSQSFMGKDPDCMA